jgi:hypothetical protein
MANKILNRPRVYRIFTYHSDGTQSGDCIECADENAAIAIAKTRLTGNFLEVWLGTRPVCRLERLPFSKLQKNMKAAS